MTISRLYYSISDGGTSLMRSVKVLPRYQREICRKSGHKWKRRSIQEVKSNWASVCCLCGALARGLR